MNKYSVINLKTDPELKRRAVEAADKLGISISMLLNNELRRFAAEQSVTFELLEVPNAKTAKLLADSRKSIDKSDFYTFSSDKEALEFLASELE